MRWKKRLPGAEAVFLDDGGIITNIFERCASLGGVNVRLRILCGRGGEAEKRSRLSVGPGGVQKGLYGRDRR